MKKQEILKNTLRHSPVLSLQLGNITRHYYFIKDKLERCFYLLDERECNCEPESYAVFPAWEDIICDLKRFETELSTESRWWSYCPGWMAFTPLYVHSDVKGYFSDQVIATLKGLQRADLSADERNRLLAWGSVCGMLKNSNFHFLQ